MGPPAEALPVGPSNFSPISPESNGPQAGWTNEVPKSALAMLPGPSLPSLPAGAHKEILQLIAGYLEVWGLSFKIEKKSVGKDAARDQSERQRLGELILDGKWTEALQALEALQLGSQCAPLVFLLRKQQLLECINDRAQKAGDSPQLADAVADSLAALQGLSSEQEFDELRSLASAVDLHDLPAYADWTVASGRQECAQALLNIPTLQAFDTAGTAPAPFEVVPPGAVSTESRLEELLRQALAFQAVRAGVSVESAELLSREAGENGHRSPSVSSEQAVGSIVTGLKIEVGGQDLESSSAGSSFEGNGVYTPTGSTPEEEKAKGGENGISVPLLADLSVISANGQSSGEVTPGGSAFTLLRDVDWGLAAQRDPFDVGMPSGMAFRRTFMEDSLLRPTDAPLSRATSMGGQEPNSAAGDLALPVVPRVKAKVHAEKKSDDEGPGLRLTYPNKPMNGLSDNEGGGREKPRREGGGGKSGRAMGRDSVEPGERRGEERLEREDSSKQWARAKSEEPDAGVSGRVVEPEARPETKPRRASPPLEERFGPTIMVTSKPPRSSNPAAAKPSPAASPRISEGLRASAPASPNKGKIPPWNVDEGGSRKGTPKGSWSNPPSPHGEGVDPDEYDKDVRAQYEQVKALFEAERAARGDYRGERYEEVGAKYDLGNERKGGDADRSRSMEREVSGERSLHHSKSGPLSIESEASRIRVSLGSDRVPSPRPAKTSPRKPSSKTQDYGSPSISPSKHRRSSSAEKLHEAAERVPLPRAEKLERPISRSGPLERVPSPVPKAGAFSSAASTPKGITRSPSFIRRASQAGRAYSNLDPTAGFASATVLKDTQPVRTVAWDRDGNFLAVGSNSRTLRICHVWGVTGEEPGSRSSREHAKAGVPGAKVVVEERDWHMGSVYTVGWNCTGGLVATGSNDQTLKVASVQRAKGEDYGNLYFGIAGPDDIGECTFEGHDGTIRDLAFSPVAESMVLSGGAGDFGMRYWDCESGTVVCTLWGSAAAIFAMRIAPDGRTVVTGGGETTCRVWDLRTASCVRTFGQYNSQVSSLALGWDSPGGPQVIAGFAGGVCRVVDFASGKETRKLTHHTADCRSVDVSPGGRWLLTGGFDGSIGIVDARTGWRVAGVYRAHGDKVIQSRWHPGGVGFATSSADRTVRVWAPAKPTDDGD
ncbi:hypothetical protein KFL_003540030 [Klebsormidium nitens]|uniref:CTLH domain-containing protein n=1 Tax=Klebsormidium nitens TaxID=105231 RepID=A0A1Y1IEA9_KLENI|nr:hypothetical protein KFL_003540030 [Klebsormidium nitens]|eukprot:GAQ87451.1 hypothetical protein KFL_003540030 [Klebsormidium nitens]